MQVGQRRRAGCHRKSHAHQGDSLRVQPALISSFLPVVTCSWLSTALPHGHACYESQSGIQYFLVQRSSQWGKRFAENLSATARVGDGDLDCLNGKIETADPMTAEAAVDGNSCFRKQAVFGSLLIRADSAASKHRFPPLMPLQNAWRVQLH